MPRIAAPLLVLLVLLVLLPHLASAADDGPRPVAAWLAQLQTLGAKHRKGETDAQSAAATKALKEAIAKEHDGKRIQFAVNIKEVRWAKGVASIYTEAEYSNPAKPSASAPVRVYRAHPFEVLMTEAEAVEIKKGTPLRFTGELKFHADQYLFLTALGGQPLYTVKHEILGGVPIGTFTSSDCSFQIGGKQFESRWKKEEKKE